MRLSFIASSSAKAQEALQKILQTHTNSPLDRADVVVALGGDGFMLEALKKLPRNEIPVFGLNQGTVGFLMNQEGAIDELQDRIATATPQHISPLEVHVETHDNHKHTLLAINDVSFLRQASQAANLQVDIDDTTRIENLMCDGVLLATPAGSTAYNFSANGPILPLGANVLALTPLAAFRPRRWRGAVIQDQASFTITNLDPEKRPVLMSADNVSVKNIRRATIHLRKDIVHTLLFDASSNLEHRILAEQFL